MNIEPLRDEQTLMGVFATLAVVATIGTVVMLGGGMAELLTAFAIGFVVAGFVVGVYMWGRRSGHPHSHAVAEASVAFGGLYLIALVVRLLTEHGVYSI